MHALHLPTSISNKVYAPFECISSDHIPFSKLRNGQLVSYSVRGYTGAILYNDKATDKVWVYLVKAKSEWIATLKRLIQDYGPERNEASVPLQILQSDFCTELQSHEATTYLRDIANIRLQGSAPYTHAQNSLERKWQFLKSTHVGAMLQNAVPVRYWCYALQYAVNTHNMLPRDGHTKSRDEEFSGVKSDISKCVPFYSHGWALISTEEHNAKRRRKAEKCTTEHAAQCRMLGYTDPYEVPNSTGSEVWVKNSYTCFNLETQKIMCRHYCR